MTPEEYKEQNQIELCILMHDTYEEAAKEVGWQTQEACRVAFCNLPEANRLVMMRVAAAVIERHPTLDEQRIRDYDTMEAHFQRQNTEVAAAEGALDEVLGEAWEGDLADGIRTLAKTCVGPRFWLGCEDAVV
jgi:hypothetical protein